MDGDTPPPEAAAVAEPEPSAVKIPFALVREGQVVERLDPPKILHEVSQHVELLLALCVKRPDLLDS